MHELRASLAEELDAGNESPTERKKRMKEAFRKMDQSKDGKLNVKELKDLAEFFGLKMK
jgi:Ca2+-binding EF-hand superfamily protein